MLKKMIKKLLAPMIREVIRESNKSDLKTISREVQTHLRELLVNRVHTTLNLSTGVGKMYVERASKATDCDVSHTTIAEVQEEAQRLTNELI